MNTSPVCVLRGHLDGVQSVKILNSNMLFSGGIEGHLKLWNLVNKRPCLEQRVHTKSILSIDLLSDDQLVTSSRDGTCKLWSQHGGSLTLVSELLTCTDHFCNATTCFETLASIGDSSSAIVVKDFRCGYNETGTMVQVNESNGMLTSLRFASEKELFCGCEDGSVLLYDLRKYDKPLLESKLHLEPVFALDASFHTSDERKAFHLMIGGASNKVTKATMWYGESGADSVAAPSLKEEISAPLPAAGVSQVRLRKDGRLVVSAQWDHTVRLFDARKMKPLAVLRHHRDGVHALDIFDGPIEKDNDGVTQCLSQGSFASGSKDGTIALWDLYASTYRSSP